MLTEGNQQRLNSFLLWYCIMNKFDKKYYERYAKLTLVNAFPVWGSHFSIEDRPDLQNEMDGIGIEVTSSTPSQIREVDSFGAKLLGKKVSVEEEKKFRGQLLLTPERVAWAYSPTRGLINTNRSPQVVAAISNKRTVWEQKGYKVFRIRGLYVFSGTLFFDDWMLEKVEKSEDFSFFQIVIINAMDRICYYQNGWKEKRFTEEELAEFNEKALMMEKSHDQL